MSELSREEFLAHIEPLRDDVLAIHDRLDKLNDRTRVAEQAIAVLNDRASPAQAAAWGGGSAGFVISVVEGLKWWLHN